MQKLELKILAVDTKILAVDTKLTEMDKRLAYGIDAVEKQTGRNFYLILGLIALIAIAVGVPHVIVVWQGRKLREQTDKYDELKREIQLLKQELIAGP